MSDPAICLEVLPAGFGDCLLVSCPVDGRMWRMLIDTGPDETYPALRKRLLDLPANADGRRFVDLFVVSHIDHDHIGGASLLLNDTELRLAFGDIWFNAPPRKKIRGVAEGQSLADILGATNRNLPWNLAADGGPICTPRPGEVVEWQQQGWPSLTILSPSPVELKALFETWETQLEKLRAKEHDSLEEAPAASRSAEVSLEALAARRTATDRAVPNGSSIAMLLEHRGRSVLLSADAFATVLVPAIDTLVQRRGGAGALHVDAVKLSHHGSRANVTQDLMRRLDSEHFVFSTNNAYFGHPNPEAVARVLTRGGRTTLWFNYDTEANRKWSDPALMARYGYSVTLPEQSDAGVTLRIN